jgi:hypothetical protein
MAPSFLLFAPFFLAFLAR